MLYYIVVFKDTYDLKYCTRDKLNDISMDNILIIIEVGEENVSEEISLNGLSRII